MSYQEELRIRDEALAADTGDPAVDAYERQAIMAHWEKRYPYGAPDPAWDRVHGRVNP